MMTTSRQLRRRQIGRWAAIALALIATSASAAAQDGQGGQGGHRRPPQHEKRGGPVLEIAEQGYFFVGQQYYTTAAGVEYLANQTYVEFQIPRVLKHPYPIVIFPGGGQTATNYTGTPDGRPGWVQFFLADGYAVYVVDEVGRGRAPWSVDQYGPIPAAGRYTNVEQRFTAPERFNQWPQARLHTQWPGEGPDKGLHGDPVFDQFLASQVPSIPSAAQEIQQQRAGAEILDQIGPAIVLTHSASGPYGWLIADARPRLVKGLLQVEPNGPPFYSVVNLGPPDWFADGPLDRPWGLARIALTYAPAVTDPSQLTPERQARPDAPDLVRCWLQAEPARQLPNLQGIPILIITGEASYHAAYDHCTSQYLRQAGVDHDFIPLADRGIYGNGHMLMLEENNRRIARLLVRWLDDNVNRHRRKSDRKNERMAAR